jgi:hypothetical protein
MPIGADAQVSADMHADPVGWLAVEGVPEWVFCVARFCRRLWLEVALRLGCVGPWIEIGVAC